MIQKKPISIERKEQLTRNLMCAVLFTAAQDYVGETSDTNKSNLPKYIFDKATILRDLKHPRMVSLSNGMSLTVARALKENPEGIKENLQSIVDDYNLVKVDTYDQPKFR